MLKFWQESQVILVWHTVTCLSHLQLSRECSSVPAPRTAFPNPSVRCLLMPTARTGTSSTFSSSSPGTGQGFSDPLHPSPEVQPHRTELLKPPRLPAPRIPWGRWWEAGGGAAWTGGKQWHGWEGQSLAGREASARERKGRARPEACRAQVAGSAQAAGWSFLPPVLERKWGSGGMV